MSEAVVNDASLTYLSLFSGVGGIDLGLDRAGMTCVGQVEIDPYCQRVLARHWPGVPRHDDVRTVIGWWGNRPAPDLVAAGFPCQPVSRGGYRRVQADERWLWPAVAEVVRHLRPRWLLLENVSGLLDRGMGEVLGDLAAIRYDAEWQVICASDVGAPHGRERVVVLAYPEGVYGLSRGVLVESRDGRAPQPVGGLPGLAEDQRRAAAVEWLEREPRVDRLAHGLPAQVDRLRVAGNSVVPQLAEFVGSAVLAASGVAA